MRRRPEQAMPVRPSGVRKGVQGMWFSLPTERAGDRPAIRFRDPAIHGVPAIPDNIREPRPVVVTSRRLSKQPKIAVRHDVHVGGRGLGDAAQTFVKRAAPRRPAPWANHLPDEVGTAVERLQDGLHAAFRRCSGASARSWLQPRSNREMTVVGRKPSSRAHSVAVFVMPSRVIMMQIERLAFCSAIVAHRQFPGS